MKNPRQRILVFAASVLISFSPSLYGQSAVVDPGSVSASAGATVQVPLLLASSGGAVPAIVQANIGFDPAILQFVRALDGPAATSAGKSVTFSSIGAGALRLVIAGLNQNTIPNGTVALHLGSLGPLQPARTALG